MLDILYFYNMAVVGLAMIVHVKCKYVTPHEEYS